MRNNGFALYGKEDLRPYAWEMPESEAGGVVIRVQACGICGSDRRQYYGGPSPRYQLPIVLGHEIVGRVQEVGSQVKGFIPEDLVTIAPIIPCMNCSACWRGQDNLCERGLVVGVDYSGGMAEHFYVPAHMVAVGGLVKVPDGVEPEAAAMSELLACCWHGLRQTQFRAGYDVLLIGSGPIGATFTQLLRLLGAARITITGSNPHRLAIAAELGTDVTLNAQDINLPKYACENGYAPDLAIIVAPTVEDAAAALEIVRPGGEMLLFSGYPHGSSMSFDLYKFHYSGKHIHSSIDATIADFHQAVKLQCQLNMSRLITHRFPLNKTVEGFETSRYPDAMKVLIKP